LALYLVTGGAGFIGSHMVEEIVHRGDSVRVIDNLTTGFKRNLSKVMDKIDFLEGDICDPETLAIAMKDVQYVIHLAALSSVVRSIEDPIATTEVNVIGTLRVLMAAREAKVRRVVMAATGAAYGNSPTMPLIETQMPEPLSPYALVKLAGEFYGKIYYKLFGLEFVALRFFNIFGPRQNPKSPYTGVLSKFIVAYLTGKTPVIFGNGEQSRDFTYVANVVDASLRACVMPEAPGRVINVGTGIGTTLNQTISTLNNIFGIEVKPQYTAPRLGDVLHSRAEISQAKVILQYEPIVNFEDGLRSTIDWLRTEM
jgi:UDP-N-acetylglucosamine/UDP-N-acetyl-alpha-D-glucosaminouronate 4-epimerase